MDKFINSFAKNKKGIIIMVFSSLLACTGQMFWKISAKSDDSLFFLLIGLAVFLLSAAFMLVGFRYGKLSILQPIYSINYIVSLIVGHFLFNEIIKPVNIAGVVIITVGVLLICGGDTDE